MEIKICGLTQISQAVAIAQMGVTAIGVICVPRSPRYVPPEQQRAINQALANYPVWRVGVFANAPVPQVIDAVERAGFDTVQLHGDESPADCQSLRQAMPHLRLIKAIRVRHADSLTQATRYQPWVNRLLLDAYHPEQLGGTGHTWDWKYLRSEVLPAIPWWLAGGITPENCEQALAQTQPYGIDVSSGVEMQPGWKDVERVQLLVQRVRSQTLRSST
ncbi:MAG: phosphoribosylanthranilate isomerase [Gloeomargarita sp. SKYBB_i_bin120]|nr:phosphoribosylanthranilate isomerase [Gloeomargarita sp. SKYG98]MCS7292898.1 phosphoribosylanthranilate isomerase [Gloeomargarita sp. SKYB120]MDW8178461.1 phosphoribosylanthranilate isomerase [Gloeomargarita sp. SKYBB_i_bin120]